MSREDQQLKIRLPAELKEKVELSAKAYKRSMNADIVARLERSFMVEPELSPLRLSPEEYRERLARAKEHFGTEKIEVNKVLYKELLQMKSDFSKLAKLIVEEIGPTLDEQSEIDPE